MSSLFVIEKAKDCRRTKIPRNREKLRKQETLEAEFWHIDEPLDSSRIKDLVKNTTGPTNELSILENRLCYLNITVSPAATKIHPPLGISRPRASILNFSAFRALTKAPPHSRRRRRKKRSRGVIPQARRKQGEGCTHSGAKVSAIKFIIAAPTHTRWRRDQNPRGGSLSRDARGI